MKKILCLTLALCMVGGILTGCGNKDEHGHNMLDDMEDWHGAEVSGDDLPYGAMTTEIRPENDPKIQQMICFDSRYFAEYGSDGDLSDIYKIHDYIVALNTADGKLMESVYYPGFLAYLSLKNGYDDVQDFVDYLHKIYEDRLGKDFEIDYIDVSNCYKKDDSQGESYFSYVDTAVSDFDASLLTKITDKKLTEVGGYTSYTTPEGVYSLTNHADPIVIGVCQIDGEYYIFSLAA